MVAPFCGSGYITFGEIIILLFPLIVGSKALKETSRIYSDYQSNTFFKERQFETTPESFDKRISIFADCIIHIINFEGVDIKRDHAKYKYIPLVLSRLDIVRVTFNYSNMYDVFILPFENIPNPKTEHKMTRRDWNRIKGQDFSFAQLGTVMQKRRQTCATDIYLHPPKWKNQVHWKQIPGKVAFPLLTYLSIEFWSKFPTDVRDARRSYRESQINTRWYYEILVSNTESSDYVTQAWTTGLLYNFHWFYAAPRTRWEMIYWKLGTIRNKILTTFIFCHHCDRCFPHQPVHISSRHSKSIYSLQRKISVLNSQTDNIIWKLRHFTPWEESGIFKPYFDYDPNDRWNKIYNLDDNNLYLFTSTTGHLAQHMFDQRLLFYVLGNSSYQKSDSALNDWTFDYLQSEYCHKAENKVCGCTEAGVDYVLFPHIDLHEDATWFPMQFQLHQYNLLFAACGHQTGKTAFYELISSYDKYSWLTIFPQMFIITPVILVLLELVWRILHTKNTPSILASCQIYYQYVFANFKTLIEQGFVDKSYSYFRWASSFFIIMAVILSNAYKGDNITKIISPLPPIPYASFDELVKNNFKIYAFYSQDLDFSISFGRSWSEYHKCDQCFNTMGTHCFRSTIKLEDDKEHEFKINSVLLSILKLSSFSTSESTKDTYYCDFRMSLSSSESYMLNNSMLLPPEWKYYNVIDDDEFSIALLFRNCEVDTTFALIDEEDEILSFKVNYNKFATSAKFKGAVSFGHEILGSYAKGILFNGWTPQTVLERMQGLYSSGILGWHDQFWKMYNQDRGLLQDFVRNGEYQASNLKGSITVVFAIFPVGFVPALLSFLVENWKRFKNLKINSFKFCCTFKI